MTIQPGEYGEQVEIPPKTGDPAAIGPKWQYTAARFLGIAGGVCAFLAVPRLSTSLLVFGAIAVLLGGALSLWRVLAYLPKGTPIAERARALWQNPWVLTKERRYFAMSTVTLCIVLYIAGAAPALWLLCIVAIVFGSLVVYLGSPHLFADRAIARFRNAQSTARTRTGPFEPSDLWRLTDLRNPPTGFPEIPRGEILAVVQNVRTKSYAVLIDGVAERPAEWSRWSHTDSRWETPLGTALVEAHEIWDGRPEAIVTITLPDMMIVIEGVAGQDTALANARLLTRCLTPREAAPAVTPERPGLFDRTLGYPLIPMFVGVVSAALTTTVGAVGSPGFGLSTGNLMKLMAVSAFGPPLHALATNLVGIVRPQVFRLDPKSLRSRAKVVFWLMLIPSLWSTLVLYLGFDDSPWGRVIQWVPTMACVAAFVTMLMIRSPEKKR